MTNWPELQNRIDDLDAPAVAAAVRGLTADQRRALLGPLKEYERAVRRGVMRWDRRPAIAVAGAGVLPNAATLAPWLARNDLTLWRTRAQVPSVPELVADLLVARDVPWLPDLAVRLADRLRAGQLNQPLWELTEKLVAHTGIDVPVTDGYVASWATHHLPGGLSVVDDIRRDPRRAALIPRMFEVPQVTRGLRTGDWPTTFRTLVDEGLVDRATLIDSCVGALQRGGRLGALSGCLGVLDELAMTDDEASDRTGDLVALLADSPSTVAGMAQRELRRVHAAGRLPVDTLCEASRKVLYRTEKKLAHTQLRWLDEVAGRDGAALDDVLVAAATAFAHDATDVQRRALALTVKHVGRSTGQARAELAQAAGDLPADLRAQAAQAFGEVGTAGPPAPVLAPAPQPRELAGPIGTPAELAAEIAALFATFPDRLDPIALERALAGLVTISYTDRAGLAEALGPVLTRQRITPGFSLPAAVRPWHLSNGFGLLSGIVGIAVHPNPQRSASRATQAAEEIRRCLRQADLASPQYALLCRLSEIVVGLAHAPRPRLLSTPTTHTGLITPDDLVERVRLATAEGWQPWDLDLRQALARLPRDPDQDAAARARRIGGPVADVVATRLAAGAGEDPVITIEPRTVVVRRYGSSIERPVDVKEERILATVRSSPGGMADLTEPERRPLGHRHIGCWLSCWPMILPAHGDVIAANLLPELFERTMNGQGAGHLLPMLAEAADPAGPATHLAVAYGLGARDQTDRAAAVDALVTLAARGHLDGSVLGEHIAMLVARDHLMLNRVVPGLRDAMRSGAHREVWTLVAAALPRLLPPAVEQPPRLLGELVGLGVTSAELTRPTGQLPCLATITGASQLAVQAGRLRAVLAG